VRPADMRDILSIRDDLLRAGEKSAEQILASHRTLLARVAENAAILTASAAASEARTAEVLALVTANAKSVASVVERHERVEQDVRTLLGHVRKLVTVPGSRPEMDSYAVALNTSFLSRARLAWHTPLTVGRVALIALVALGAVIINIVAVSILVACGVHS